MRIVIFHNLPPGGAKRVVDEEVKYLSQKHGVKLFECDFKIKRKSKSFLGRLRMDFNNFIILPMYHKKLAKQIDKLKFDVVLVHPDKYTQAPFILRYLKTQSIYFCEELLRIAYEKELIFKEKVEIVKKIYENETRKLRKRIDRINAMSSTKIIVGSRYIQKKVKAAYNKKALLCPLGVDADTFKPKKTERINQILFVGEKDKINGYLFAKKVAESAKVKLKIVGGQFSDKELAGLYSNSLATICVGYNEPFGLVPLESMACETPVLAVNEGGYKEAVVDGVTGYLLKRNVQDFVDKLNYLANNPKVVQKLGENGRQHVIKNSSWEKHCEKIEGVLKIYD